MSKVARAKKVEFDFNSEFVKMLKDRSVGSAADNQLQKASLLISQSPLSYDEIAYIAECCGQTVKRVHIMNETPTGRDYWPSSHIVENIIKALGHTSVVLADDNLKTSKKTSLKIVKG